MQALVLKTIAGLPHGVIKMSADIPGLVETSTNVAVLKTEKGKITLITSQRSSVASEIQEICQTVACVFELGGAKVEKGEGYPGWKPNLDSPILKGREIHVSIAVRKRTGSQSYSCRSRVRDHREKYPGIDMSHSVPTMQAVHSPDEKIHIDTVEKFWKFLLAILKNVN